MSTVNLGWLKDADGEKFAPKTLGTQVVTENGDNLEGIVNNLSYTVNNITTASEDKLGLVKVGSGLNINNEGVVSAAPVIQMITWELND